MKKFLLLALNILGLVGQIPTALAENFILTSPNLEPNGRLDEDQVYSEFGCTGKNLSPALQWKNFPDETKSFAVTLFDPDAPTGFGGWVHWVIFNIPANVNQLAVNAGNPISNLAPKGSIQSITDFGKPGFGGACPPVGSKPHRYQFTVYALDTEGLPLDANATPALVGFYLNQHTLAKSTLEVFYSR